MARENQGLQIALIVFVMLTIIFGVVAFISYRNYSEALANVQDQTRKAADEKKNADKYLDELTQLKQRVDSFQATDDTAKVLETIKKEVSLDVMQSFPEANRTCLKAIRALNDALLDKSKALAAEKDNYAKLKAAYDQRESVSQQQIKLATDIAAKANNDRIADRGERIKERDKAVADSETQLAKNKEIRSKAEQDNQLAKNEVDAAKKETQTFKGLAQNREEKIAKLTKATFDAPAGKIEWVDQRTRHVWINLGQSSHLSRLTSFSVYDSQASNVAHAEPKASIEVTDILGPTLAMARIVSEVKASDPILVGDVIHTPIWTPGQKKHFALVGFIDIDKDGRSDQDMIVKLIESSGGTVDSFFDSKEGRRKGKLTVDTNYLVRGAEPKGSEKAEDDEGSGKVFQQWVKDWNDATNQANDYAIRTVPVDEFLSMMGYKPDARVIDYRRPDPQSLRAQPPEGGQKKSSGNVSPLFQPRNPPSGGPVRAQ